MSNKQHFCFFNLKTEIGKEKRKLKVMKNCTCSLENDEVNTKFKV